MVGVLAMSEEHRTPADDHAAELPDGRVATTLGVGAGVRAGTEVGIDVGVGPDTGETEGDPIHDGGRSVALGDAPRGVGRYRPLSVTIQSGVTIAPSGVTKPAIPRNGADW